MKRFVVTPELIGKYINRGLFTDIDPVGKIVGIKGKTTVLIQPIQASRNLTEMKFNPGGFAGHCVNQDEQSYEFTEVGEVSEVKLSNTFMKNFRWYIHNEPRKYYDYNF